MINNFPIYEISKEDSEIFAISLVENPAIEENFLFLAKQENQKYICLESDEKHMVYGCVLKPNFPIYRRDDDGFEYYIQFSKDTIEKLSKDFLKNGFQANWTVDHNNNVNDLTVVESWLKADMEKDKSIVLGLDENLPVGSWIVGVSIDNPEIWEDIKNKKWFGFSVESFVKLNELNIQNNMQKENLEQIDVNESFWSKLREIISDALGLSPKDEVIDEVVVDDMAKCNPDDEDEKKKKVEMEVIEEVKDEAVIDVSENVEEKILTENDKIDTLKATIDELQAKLDELTSEMEAKNLEIEQLKEKNIKLSKQPSVNPNVKGNKNENKFSFLDYAQGKIKY